jgi:hypothetical protein
VTGSILKRLTSPDGFSDGVAKCSSNVTDVTDFKIDLEPDRCRGDLILTCWAIATSIITPS